MTLTGDVQTTIVLGQDKGALRRLVQIWRGLGIQLALVGPVLGAGTGLEQFFERRSGDRTRAQG